MFDKIKTSNKKVATVITIASAIIAGVTACISHISDAKQTETINDLVDRVNKLEGK